MLLTSSWIMDLLVLFAASAVFLYKYSTRKFDYWKTRGVYHPKPIPFLGNIADVAFFRICIGDWLKKIYDSTDEPYFGVFVFDEPHLIIKSPELIKHILIKDYPNFPDRTVAQPKHNKMMSNLMFFQKNPGWIEARSKLSPVFSSGKLKMMFLLVQGVAENFLTYLEEKEGGEVEAKEVCIKFATDVIAKCFFGINAHCFDDEEATFRKLGRTVFDISWRNGFVHTAYFFRQKWVDYFKLDFVKQPVMDYFHEAFSETIRARKNCGAKKYDLIDILNELKINKQYSSNMPLETEKLVGPAIQFFLAGFETTSSTIAFTLYELCLNKSIQDKLRNEVISIIKTHGGITYEGLMGIKYMDMCVKETLRKYPVLPFLDRTCNEEYRLPGTDLVIDKGFPVYIPMFGLHLDEKYFPEPNKYDPERFQNKNVNSGGLVYIPFGDCPRACIGERFGMMSTKAALAYILTKFEVEKCGGTPDPVVFEPKSFVLRSSVGLPIIFKRIVPTPA